MYICIYIYIYTHVYIYIYIYVCTLTCGFHVVCMRIWCMLYICDLTCAGQSVVDASKTSTTTSHGLQSQMHLVFKGMFR